MVASLMNGEPGTYRERTATIQIGQLLPDRGWHEWLVGAETADSAAEEMAAAVETYAAPWLVRMATDQSDLIQATKESAGYAQATGKCRVAVLLAQAGQVEAARSFVEDLRESLGTRTDPAAAADRRWVAAFMAQQNS
jgi:hypothetical protein